jgi:hypothetical protein
MPKTGSPIQWATFIVRFWQRGYRGQVEHVPSGEKKNFKSLEQLYEILKHSLEHWDEGESQGSNKLSKPGAQRS